MGYIRNVFGFFRRSYSIYPRMAAYLCWGLKDSTRTYFGLFGAPGLHSKDFSLYVVDGFLFVLLNRSELVCSFEIERPRMLRV